MFTVILSEAAQKDIRQNTSWWSENRSAEQAERWYVGIIEKIFSLENMPPRCAQAPEAAKLNLDIRHLLFGISSRPTDRVLFQVYGQNVVALRVLHMSQMPIDDAADLS